jgi:peptidyl-dipeptidase Dcp
MRQRFKKTLLTAGLASAVDALTDAKPAGNASANMLYCNKARCLWRSDFSKIKSSDYLPALKGSHPTAAGRGEPHCQQQAESHLCNTIVALEESGRTLDRILERCSTV